jgi:hypothetical protein
VVEVTPVGAFLGCLATYRLTWLVVKDDITAPIRDWIQTRGATNAGWRWLGNIVTCPFCSSVYLGLGVALIAGHEWRAVFLGWWAFAGATAVLAPLVALIEDVRANLAER